MLTIIPLFFYLNTAYAGPDCSRTKNNVEKILCFSTRAINSQEKMAYAFRLALRRGVSPELLRETQEKWKKETRDKCSTVDCIVEAHKIREFDLYELPGK